MESKPDGKQAREAAFRGNELAARLLRYSVRIVRVVESMPKTRTGNHVAGQLLRAGTSPLSNHGEAQAAESMLDFIHKLRICLKELRETQRWLLLAKEVPLIEPASRLNGLIQETDELIRIFVSSIQTSRAKLAKKSKS